MATIKAVLRPKKNKRGEQPIYIRISHKGKTKYHSIGIQIKYKYWNEIKGEVRPNDEVDYNSINKVIRDGVKKAKDKVYDLKARGERVSVKELKASVKGSSESGFFTYADKFVMRKYASNIRTGKRYQSIVAKIKEYSDSTLQFSDLTVTWIKDYSDWLAKEKGNAYSTIHSNLRGIRAIINEAIREDLITLDRNPFLKLKLERPKPKKTKLNVEEIEALKALKIFTSELQKISRDAFLFSFYTCGMRFTDLCLLTWGSIEGNHLKYHVSKTKEDLSVELVPEVQEILIDYFPLNKNKQLLNELPLNNKAFKQVIDEGRPIFPLLKGSILNLKEEKKISRISNANAKVNSALKIVAKNAGISKRLSFHIARHSYANIANNLNMPLSVIQNTLNHKSVSTTEAYLKSLESNVVDESVRNFFATLRESK